MNTQPIPEIPKPADLTELKDLVKNAEGIGEQIFVKRQMVLWLIDTVEILQKNIIDAAHLMLEYRAENQKLREICEGAYKELNKNA